MGEKASNMKNILFICQAEAYLRPFAMNVHLLIKHEILSSILYMSMRKCEENVTTNQ